MIFRELGGYGLAVITIFSVAVFESFLYLIANGALDWGPVKKYRHGRITDAGRGCLRWASSTTSATTAWPGCSTTS
jgi:hypothetical protein